MPGGVVLGTAIMELSTDNSKFVGGLQEAARQSDSAFSKIAKTAAATAAGILVYKGLGAAIGAVKDTIGGLAAGFEQQLNILQAVSGAGTEQMAALSAQAKALGNDLTLPKTSAKDAAEAMTELGKAGLSINNIMGASKGVLELAAAGNLSNARAAEIAANALNAFGLAGTEATRVADLLAAAANASSLEVTDAADAMQMSAAIFASAGIPIEDLITSISELGNAGIKGSDAGTSLKQMLLQLQTPTNKAKDLMRDMGFSVYDAAGNMVSMRDIIGRLQVATAGMTQQQRDFALGTIFGSDAIRSANVLIRDGVAGFDTMKDAVTKEGAAAALAAARNKGFTGALDGLKSAIETVQITIGSLLIPSLTRMIRSFAYGVTQIEPLAHLFSLGFNGGQIGGEFSRIEKAVFAAGQTFRTIVQFVREFVGTVRRELLPSLDPLRPQFAQLGDSLLRLGAALPQLMPLLHDLGTVLLNVGRRYLPLLVVSWTLWLNVLTTSVDLLTRFIGALTDNEGTVTKLGRAVEIVAGTVVGLWALNKVAQTLVDTGNSAVTAYSALSRTLRGVNDVLNPMAGATRQVADAIGGLKDKTIRLAIDGLETAYIHMLELDGILKGLTNKTVTFTQNIVTTGAAFVGDFIDKVVTITQDVVRTGKDWITDFTDKVQSITQKVTVESPDQSVTESIGKKSGGWFGSGMIVGIGSFLGGTAARMFATSLGGASIVGALGTIGGILGGALVAGLVPAIAYKIGGVNWATVFSPIGTAGTAIAVLILGSPSMAGEISSAFIEIFGRVAGVVSGVVASIFSGVAMTVINSLGGTLIQNGVAILMPVGGRLIDAIADGARQAWPNVLSFFQGLPSQIGHSLDTASGAIGIALEGIPGFFEKLPGRIASALAALPGAFTATLTFFAGIPANIGGMLSALPGIVSGITSATLSFFANLPGQIGSAISALPGIVGAITSAIGTFFSALPGTIGTAISSIPGIVTGVFDSLPEPVRNAMANVGSAVQIGWDVATTMTTTALGIIASEFGKGWENVNQITGGKLEEMRQTVSAWPGQIADALGDLSGFLTQKGTDLVQGLLNGITSGWSAVSTWAMNVGGDIAAGVGDLSMALWSAGTQLIAGLIAGIENKAESAVSAVVGVAQRVVAAALGPAGFIIRSPSHVFYDIGVNTMEGLALGITDGGPGAVAAVASVVNGVVAQSITSFSQMTAAGTLAGQSLAQQLNQIASEISAMLLNSTNTGTQFIGQMLSDFGVRVLQGFNYTDGLITDALHAFTDQATALGATFDTVALGMVSAFENVSPEFKAVFQSYVEAVLQTGDVINNFLNLLPPELSDTAALIGKALHDGMASMTPDAIAQMGLLKHAIEDGGSGVVATAQSLTAQLNAMWADYLTRFNGDAAALAGYWHNFNVTAKQLADGMVGFIAEDFTLVGKSFYDLTDNVKAGLAPLTPFLLSIQDAINLWGDGIVASMTDTFKQALAISAAIAAAGASGSTTPVLGGATSTAAAIRGSAAPPVQPHDPNASAAFNHAVDIANASNAMNAGIPSLSTGAYIKSPTLALLGESAPARPEIVAPERMLRRIIQEEGGGGRGDNHVYGSQQFVLPNVRNGDDFMRELGMAF